MFRSFIACVCVCSVLGAAPVFASDAKPREQCDQFASQTPNRDCLREISRDLVEVLSLTRNFLKSTDDNTADILSRVKKLEAKILK